MATKRRDDSARLRIEYVEPTAITGYARNAKLHPQRQIDALKASMTQFGFNNPILVDADDVIVAGHGRFEAAKQLGLATLPIIRLGHLTPDQRRAYVIADNKIGDMATYDTELLAREIAEIQGIDTLALGISAKDVDAAVKSVKDLPGLMGDNPITDEDRSLMVMQDDVIFPFEGRWELPALRKDRLLKVPPKLSLWTYNRATEVLDLKPPYLYNYGMDSTRGMPWDKVVVSFYTDDYKFECFWDDTMGCTKELLANKVIGAVSPNYSTFPNVSTTLRQFNTYRARYVTRYMQEAGINIVPDLNCMWYQPEFEVVVDGLRGFHTLAIQAHQTLTGAQRVRQNDAFAYALDETKASTVLLYAPSDALTLYPALAKVRVVRVEPNTKVKAQYRKALDQKDAQSKQ